MRAFQLGQSGLTIKQHARERTRSILAAVRSATGYSATNGRVEKAPRRRCEALDSRASCELQRACRALYFCALSLRSDPRAHIAERNPKPSTRYTLHHFPDTETFPASTFIVNSDARLSQGVHCSRASTLHSPSATDCASSWKEPHRVEVGGAYF